MVFLSMSRPFTNILITTATRSRTTSLSSSWRRLSPKRLVSALFPLRRTLSMQESELPSLAGVKPSLAIILICCSSPPHLLSQHQIAATTMVMMTWAPQLKFVPTKTAKTAVKEIRADLSSLAVARLLLNTVLWATVLDAAQNPEFTLL